MSVRVSSDAAPVRPAPLLALALGVLLAPWIALVHQEVVYGATMWACQRGRHTILHVVPVTSVAAIAVAFLLALLCWRRAGADAGTPRSAARVAPTRFLALVGLAISI